MSNPYTPHLATIQDIKLEVDGARPIKTFTFTFNDKTIQESFKYMPGQTIMISVLGVGESMFAISSYKEEYLQVSVMKVGLNTSALHGLEIGDIIGARGPYGNPFPVKDWEGKNIVFIGGGIGQAPLRPIIQYMLANHEKYEKLTIIYGARTSGDLVYKDELFELEKTGDIGVHLSIDVEEEGWTRFVGFVPTNLMEVKPSPENTIAITCGPPIMIKFVIQNLEKLGFAPEQIYTTLEARMKCGIGKCGRCNVGNLYICKDGPVFCWDALKEIKADL
ncbi:MAG: FAD/NAD(P)-binding protein [Candidatus Helarchaeota archaeon]|nr:FAD/NAD(P)-binding protein [Candidatus Helarchaeota archaeon]